MRGTTIQSDATEALTVSDNNNPLGIQIQGNYGAITEINVTEDDDDEITEVSITYEFGATSSTADDAPTPEAAPGLDGLEVIYTYDVEDGSWSCSTEVEQKYVSGTCESTAT